MEPAAAYCLYLFLALLIPLLLLRLKKRGRDDGARLPPGPWQLPVIGSLHHLVGKPLAHRAMADLARRLDAPLMYLKLGEVPVVVASSPDAAREILRAHDPTFATRPWTATIKIMMADGHGLGFAPYGELWRQLRRISVSELLSARRVRSFHRVRENEAARLVAAVAETPPGEAANVSARVAAAVADSTVRAMLGDRFGRREEFLEAIEETNRLASGFNLSDLFPSSRVVGLKNFELMEYAIKQHEERRAGGGRADEDDDDLLGGAF